MPNVEFKVGNQKFDLVCDEGQQAQIKMLARNVDGRVTKLAQTLGSAPDGLLLVVSALMMEDELQSLKNQKPESPEPSVQASDRGFLTSEEGKRVVEEVVTPVVDYIEALAEKIENM